MWEAWKSWDIQDIAELAQIEFGEKVSEYNLCYKCLHHYHDKAA